MSSTHIPLRPSWICAGCSRPWPCATRRGQLVAEYSADALPLGLYLAACLVDAAYDLPDIPAGELYQRFLGWLRGRHTVEYSGAHGPGARSAPLSP